MYRKLLSAIFAGLLSLTPAMEMMAQRPGSSSAGRNASGNHRSNSAARPGGQTNSVNSTSSSRPANSATNHRPNNNSSVRPGNSGNASKPGGGAAVKPGNNWGNPVRPGGSSAVRPGGSSAVRPGASPVRPGNSAMRPGAGSKPVPAVRPPYSPLRPGYRPGVVVNNYGWYNPYPGRWERPLPPPPVFPVNIRPVYTVPSISSVLGLTFGTLIDVGLNSLIRAGYNVVGSVNDAIYLSNVMQFGYTWPQVSVYYGPSGLASTRFQYLSSGSSQSRYRSVYNQLCTLYGSPVLENVNNGIITATWWGGDRNGYVSLTFGPGVMQNGSVGYFTDIIYGSTLYPDYYIYE